MGAPMPEPYEHESHSPQELTDVETARLALRGAVESLRSLQEVNQRLKGEIQDYTNRNKMLDQRLIALQTDLNVTHAKLDKQDQVFEKKEAELRRHIRQEVAIEENERWQAEMASLRQSVEMWKAAREQKEDELKRLKETLAHKENDVLDLQKEKVVLQGKANQDLAASLLKARADLKQAVEAVIQEKDKQLEKVKLELTGDIEELDARLRMKEQEIQGRDESIAKQFHDRQKELSVFWAKREQEIWDRAKQAKETLEAGLNERWEKRLEELTKDFAQKTYVMEQNYANLKAILDQKEQDLKNQVQTQEQTLQETFTKKTTSLEQSMVERAAALEMQWNAKEKELTKSHRKALDTERARFNEDLHKAKEEATSWMVARDAEFHAKQAELRQKHQNLEKDLRETWGKREEELALRHAQEIQKAQETLAQTLRDKLTAAAEEYRKHLETLQLQLADVDKKRILQETELKALLDRTLLVEKERAQLSEALKTQEASFRKQLEEKEKSWNATHEALRRQSLENAQSAFEKNEAQKVRIADLEKRDAEAAARLKSQEDRIQQQEKDHKTLSETLQEREATLHAQLDTKEREWATANEALRAQLSTLTSESLHRTESQRGRIVDLEKRCEEQATQFKGLQTDYNKLDHAHALLGTRFKTREAALLTELDQKQREWKGLQETLQAQLTLTTAESAKTDELQKARIAELERLSLEAQSAVKILQQKLLGLEKERTALSETLQSHEVAFRKQLEDREREWTVLNGTLREQLEALTRQTSQKIEALQELASSLEKQKAEITAHAQALENQILTLTREKGQISETLKTREAALLKELDIKQAEWKAVQDTLQEQLKKTTGEAAQRNEVQTGRIADLETQNLNARSEVKILQQKLEGMQTHEAGLLKDFEQKRREWTAAQEALQAQYQTYSKEAVQKHEGYQARISDLERLNAEAGSQIQGLQQRIEGLDKERTSLMQSLQYREATYQKQIQESEKTWAASKDALNQQIAAIKHDASKKEETLLAQIAHLEKQITDIRAQWMASRERLNNTEKLRQDTSDKFELAEKTFRLELADKERAWNAAKEALQQETAAQKAALAEAKAAHESSVADHEKYAAETQSDIHTLKEKLQALEKERNDLALALQTREHDLQLQLDTKMRDWTLAKEALNEKLASVSREAALKQKAQQDAIADLQARHKDASAQIVTLQGRLADLAKERDSSTESFISRDAALRKELAEKETLWTKTRDDLQSQLGDLRKLSARDAAAQKDRISELEKHHAENEKYISTLKDKLQFLEKERAALSMHLQNKERDLTLQMEEKTRLWTQTREGLESKLAALTQESTQTQKAQAASIADLELQQKDASARVRALQEKLQKVEKERDTLSETLREREAGLRRELAEKEEAWQKTHSEFQERLSVISGDAVRQKEDLQARLVDLSKRHAESLALTQALQTKLAALDTERQALAETLRARETLLREELERKQAEWKTTHLSLKEHIETMSRETSLRNTQKQAQLEALEKRAADAERHMQALHEKLQTVEKERQTLTEILNVREAALKGELAEKQSAWAFSQETLQDQLAVLKREADQKDQLQQAQVARLSEQNTQAEEQVQKLKEQLRRLEEDHARYAGALQVKEQELQKQLENKQRQWALTQESLEQKLAGLTREAAGQQKTQQGIIADLEARQKEASGQIASLQERLTALGKERDSLANTLSLREAALRKELSEKEKDWSENRESLQGQVGELKSASAREILAYKERISELEKRGADFEKSVYALREKLQALDKEKAALSMHLQNKERDLTLQLDEKTRSWDQTQETLEAKLAAVTRESVQTQKAQAAVISDFELRQKDAALKITALQAALQKAEQERDAAAETLRERETLLRRSLADKEETWQRTQRDLQERLTSVSGDSVRQIEEQQGRLSDLTQRYAEAQALVQSLQTKQAALETDRQALADALRTREALLKEELERKQREWTAAEGALKYQLETMARETALRNTEKQAQLTTLEKRAAEADRERRDLRAKLQSVEKERQNMAESFSLREASLKDELAQKESAWVHSSETLKEQSSTLKRDASKKDQVQQQQIARLEKQHAEAAEQVQALRDQLRGLHEDRTTLLASLKTREEAYRAELADKQQSWTLNRESMEAQIASFKHEAQLQNGLQQSRIADLEKRNADAARAVTELKGKLDSVEKQSAELALQFNSREQELLQQLDSKGHQWDQAKAVLEDKVNMLSRELSQKQQVQRALSEDLDARQKEAEAQIDALKKRLAGAEKDRDLAVESLREREGVLRKELDEKTRQAERAQRHLQDQLTATSGGTAREREEQQAKINDLTRRHAEAEAQAQTLQLKLRELEKERKQLHQSTESREGDLRRELEHKQKEWQGTREELMGQIDKLKKDAGRQREELRAQIAELEQKSAEAAARTQGLRDQIDKLEKERESLVQELRQRETDVEKRRTALEQTMKQREQELEQRTQKLEEDLRKTWADKERTLSNRIQSAFEKEQAQFWDRVKNLQSNSKEQVSRLQEQCLRQEEELTRRKEAMDVHEREMAAHFEERERTLREMERDKAEWSEKIGQLQKDEQDIQRRQAQIQSREGELDHLRQQLTSSLDAGGKASSGAVHSLVEEWVFGFAHQVRNPLGIIRSMTESMMQTKLSGKSQKESFGAILQAVDGLAHRLGEFIDFSKPLKASFRMASLSDAADSALAQVRTKAAEQKVEIRTSYSDKVTPFSLDPEQLQTALMHLLANALEAMPQGGTLTVETRQEGGMAALKIQDTGAGISAAHMREIGRPFFTTKPGHIGLGLAGAKRILHVMGGELIIHSQPGQGASMVCRFKLKGK
jgi:signal transduction histidine kinase/chromosome segregation ATPase